MLRHRGRFGFGYFEFPSCFVIRHSSLIVHISPPDEPADQFLPGALRANRLIDGACYTDATTKE